MPVEIAFNVLALALFLLLSRMEKSRPHFAARLRGPHFHIYLMAYGAFRFAHEFLRATPRVTGSFSGYQIAALACVALGAGRFVVRARSVARD